MLTSRRASLRIALVAVVIAMTAAACSSGANKASPEPSTAPATTSGASTGYPLDGKLRLNQIQVLGTHNSYHGQPYPQVLAALAQIGSGGPATAASLDYSHPPLAQQFPLGIRQLELDVWSDPQGGKYAHPSLPQALKLPPPNQQIMSKPGFKVIHEANIDTNSTCLTFVLCLQAVKTWSDANPGHVPIMIDVEMKDSSVTPATFDALDAEIRSVLSPDELIAPDDVRGSDPSLGHAIATHGWPTLGAVRGRVMFMLDNENFGPIELQGHPSLRGRILFTSSKPGADDAAVAKLNDPIADAAKIKAALAANMLVRTRADADTVQARKNDTSMRDAALASGAQFVSTDYEVPNPKFGPYVVKIPGGTPARCNPVTAPPDCRSTDIENPDALTGDSP